MTTEQWLLFLGLVLGSYIPSIISGVSGWRKSRADSDKARVEMVSIVEQTDQIVWERSAQTIRELKDEIKELRDRLRTLEGVVVENRELRRDLERLEPLMQIVAELTETNDRLKLENRQLKRDLMEAKATIEDLRQRIVEIERREDARDNGG